VQDGVHFCSGLQLQASPHGQLGEHPHALDWLHPQVVILENEVKPWFVKL
jgi:hypothetical protein